MALGRTNTGSATGGTGGVPTFTYSGTYQMINEGRGNWRLKLLTSGTLNITKLPNRQTMIDVFLVGGGGGGGPQFYGGGGGGGYTKTQTRIYPTLNNDYSITIGAGGAAKLEANEAGSDGGSSTAFGLTAAGGKGGGGPDFATNTGGGGNGGSGGGEFNGAGGSNGGNGIFTNGRSEFPTGRQGYGQGTTTREFGESGGALYAGGGGASWNGAGGDGGGGRGMNNSTAESGAANTGGGGGGGATSVQYSGAGGSGIVIIRNTRG